jgi:hypothetical protein
MKEPQMVKLGSAILKALLVCSLVFNSCYNSKNDFIDFIKKNNSNNLIDANSLDDDCFKLKFISLNKVKSKVFIIDNRKDCIGQRFPSTKNNFDFFIDKRDNFNFDKNISEFNSHLKNSLLGDDNNSMEVYLFTNLGENETDKMNQFVFDLLKVFFEAKCSQKFVPLNIFIVVNADDMIEALKKIPNYLPPI